MILYVQKEELSNLKTSLTGTINNFNEIILYSAQLLIVFTFMLVIIFCYKVAMSISKPLKSMINVANLIKTNAVGVENDIDVRTIIDQVITVSD